MKTSSQTTCWIGRPADKSGPRPSVRNQSDAKKYVTGTNFSREYPSELKNQENPNLGPLDPASNKNISKRKRIKWTSVEYKEVMTAFYQALNEPKENTTKQTYELWRQKISEHRKCIDANKLANVRTDVKKKRID